MPYFPPVITVRDEGVDQGDAHVLDFVGAGVSAAAASSVGTITIGGGAGGNTGTATLDFGALPGKQDTSVAVTGQTSIASGSIVQAWIRPVDTADHLADEHLVEGLRIYAGNIVAGTGFTIYGIHEHGAHEANDRSGASPTREHPAWGRFTVAWTWS